MHYLLVILLFSISINLSIVIAQRCGPSTKECSNGQCIPAEKWCDGKADCLDASDENHESCIGVKCPQYTFRCSYGACIGRHLKCNGNRDCLDGSDEAPIECSGLEMNSNCPMFEVQCKSSECIPQENACDGKRDCKDGSDETAITCATQRCPRYSFQCAYGACISKALKCDGNTDCADGSDEINCKEESKISVLDSSVSSAPPKSCYVPTDDYLTLVDTLSNTVLKPGTSAQFFTSVKYICPKGYFREGKFDTNFCDGDWINIHPKCIKMCPPISGITINVQCTHNEVGIPCNKYVPPGTIAKISCAVMYEKPKNRKVQDDLHCQGDGDWNYSPFKCEQVCGTVDTKIAFSVNSVVTEVVKVPWQVAIYSRNEEGKYEHICGGTLVESKIVISAAHCFWDFTTGRVRDKSNFLIAVGKFYRDYYAMNETAKIQKSNVSKIDVPVQFEGANYDYVSDIAVLTLNDHIIFENHIRPACLTWKGYAEKLIESGVAGVVAGWGITDTGTFSPDLRSVELTSIDPTVCKQRISKNEKIANDKFCVETSAGKNVCKGDSGGGFLVREEINGESYYTLWGIVSNGLTHQEDGVAKCDRNFITTFTNIQWYDTLVKNAKSRAYSLL